MSISVAIFGAGGKMGCRITDNLLHTDYRSIYVEVSPGGIGRLAARGGVITDSSASLVLLPISSPSAAVRHFHLCALAMNRRARFNRGTYLRPRYEHCARLETVVLGEALSRERLLHFLRDAGDLTAHFPRDDAPSKLFLLLVYHFRLGHDCDIPTVVIQSVG